MSHLRDLLHKPLADRPSRADHNASAIRVAPVPETESPDLGRVLTTHVLPELPVEEAHFTPEDRLIFHTDPRSPAADRFRLLRMRLKQHWKAGKLKKLLITSPIARDGKSTVTLNLATALAERGKRTVLVIEADLHHSSLTEILRLRSWVGLADCLVDEKAESLSAIRRVEPFGWSFLPAGEPRRNPTELLQTPAFGRIVQQLSTYFDWILIDSPPVVPLTDSISLQQHADASLLVVRAGQTPREAVEQTIALLGKKNIVGIVLNGVETSQHSYYQYYAGSQRPSAD
jgi:capsular exopolysaccharide synthesis family protein